MSIKCLVFDEWNGLECVDHSINNPTLLDVEARISHLNAQVFTMVTLLCEGEKHMTIGGGNGQYIVYETDDNMEFYNLVKDSTLSGELNINIGGQEGDYPKRQIVTRDDAIAVARTFFETLDLDKKMVWEKQ